MSFVTPATRSSPATPRATVGQTRSPRSWPVTMPHGGLVHTLTPLICLTVPAALLSSQWVTGAGMLWAVTLLAAIVGLLAARRKLAGLLSGIGVGMFGIIVASAHLAPPWPPLATVVTELIHWLPRRQAPVGEPFAHWWAGEIRTARAFGSALLAWWQHGAAGDAAMDQRILLLLVALLTWTVVCSFTWAIYARVTPLLAVLPPGAVLVTTSVLSGHGSLYVYLFLPTALLLVARLHLLALGQTWAARAPGGSRPGIGRQLAAALCLTLLAGVLAVTLPTAPGNGLATGFWNVATPFWNRLQSRAVTAFGQSGLVAGNDGQGLNLGGTITQQAGRVVMYVATDEPPPAPGGAPSNPTPLPALRYFLGAAYADYSGRGWQSPGPTATSRTGVPLQANGLPNYLGVAAGAETSQQRAANQPLTPAAPGGLQVVQHVQLAGGSNRLLFAFSEPRRVDRAVTVQSQGGFPDQITLVGSVAAYTVVSDLPQAGVAQLRSAGAAYPASLAPYLIRPNVPSRVAQLARQWTAGATNPYDQAMAIEAQLRRFPYTLNVPAPPAGRDPVDYFLFNLQRGYCEYFASAMVVLLREVGVPARIATGYASGGYDFTRNAYVVTEDDAHSWVQVYFPGVGWVNFEPTPANPELLPPASPTAPTPSLAITAPPVQPAAPLAARPVPIPADPGPLVGALLPFLVGLLLTVSGALTLLLCRLRRPTPSADALVRRYYVRLLRYSRWRGTGQQANETPLEFAERLAVRLDDAPGAAVYRLATMYVRLEYGAHPVTVGELREATQSWRDIRRGLWRQRLKEGRQRGQ